MAVRERHYRGVLDLVGEVHDAQDLEELRAILLPALKRLVPAEYSSYNEIPHAGGEHVAITDPEVPAAAHEAWRRLAESNPLVQRYVRTRDARPYRFSDVLSQRDFRGSEVYRELYRPLGVEHQIAFVLPAPASLTIGIALSRGGRRDFGDDERDVLDLVRPHLIQAYRNAQLRERLSGVLEAMRTGLDARGTAAIAVSAEGDLTLATEPGRRLASEVAGQVLKDGAPLPAELAALLDGAGPTGSVRLPDGDTALVHRVRSPDGAAVLFLDRARRVLSPAALVALGLTSREADVLAGFARGETTAAVAAELGISPRTVNKHAERMHRKLGVRDRAQAVATAWAATEAGAG